MYATLKNLNLANSGIIERYELGNVYPDEARAHDTDSAKTDDWYCIQLADMVSTKTMPVCTKEHSKTSSKVVNLRLINGVTIQGITTKWQQGYTGAYYAYKNFVIDIDGEKGKNRIGIDRFPLRLYIGGIRDGLIQPIDCNNDVMYDEDGTKHLLGDNPYCKHGFDMGGALAKNNMLSENEIISYDIYRARENSQNSKTDLVASKMSTMEADCGAYGGRGFFSGKQCAENSFRVFTKCAKNETCEYCKGTGYEICPLKEDGSATGTVATCKAYASTINPKDTPCFVLQQKPTAGMGLFAGGVLADIDY